LLSDLKKSDYAERTTTYLGKDYEKIKVMNFGDELSPFWKCLHELRLIDYAKADLSMALQQINNSQFHIYEENASTLAIVDSKMSIVKQSTSDTGIAGNAPDHLLRLFAYNDVMRKVGQHYFNSQDYEESVFAEAEEGYVVTPVTSMIVLESEEDYKRMGIDNNKNTVGNSGIIGGGAVPEPHEWVLIFIVLIVVMRHLYINYKEKFFIFLNR
jgi:XrtN system VIT domain protein